MQLEPGKSKRSCERGLTSSPYPYNARSPSVSPPIPAAPPSSPEVASIDERVSVHESDAKGLCGRICSLFTCLFAWKSKR